MRRLAGVALLLSCFGCSDGIVVVLGEREPGHDRFGQPRLISELSSPSKSDNPTLTADLLELYFTTDRSGGLGDVWMAKRSARTQKFSAPQPVTEVNTPGFETSAAISADGLTLWFGSDRPGGSGDLDVWMATRATRGAAWSAPSNLKALSSANKDIPRPPGQHGLVMPPASDRATPGLYQTYLSARASRSAPFGAPTILSELTFPSSTTVDAFLTDDGLSLLYSSGKAFGPTDLYLASRETTSQPFSVRRALDELNTSGDERDPWLSPDGTELYFAADRSGHLEIYVATLVRDTTATPAMP